LKEWSFPQRLSQDDPDVSLVPTRNASGTDALSVELFEDKEAAETAREIKACLVSGDTSKALVLCDRMLCLHPGNRLFEGLRLEVEKREREIRMDFIRRLSSDLETIPDLDARINTIQQALSRYPTESQLSQLLRNAQASRDFFTGLLAEARQEEIADNFTESLKRWYVIRELFPAMPGLEVEIHRVESLTHSQLRMRRRAEFVEAISRLSSTGEYARAVYQCVNALSEYPNDLGLLALKKGAEEKVRQATNLQQFISEGLTFLQARESDAALESFAKARNLDPDNLQVRYLIGVALVEKARAAMYNDRRKLQRLLDEAKSFIPDHPDLQTLSIEIDQLAPENWAQSLPRINPPATEVQRNVEPVPEPMPTVSTPPEIEAKAEPEEPQPAPEPEPVPEPSPEPPEPKPARVAAPAPARRQPAPVQSAGPVRPLAWTAVAIIAILLLGWYLLSVLNRPSGSNGNTAASGTANVSIQATPQGAQIFVDGQKAGDSQFQTQLSSGNHTVMASLDGYESQTLALELGNEPKNVQIDLKPILLALHVVTDEPGASVWLDDEAKGEITANGMTVPGVKPGARTLRIRTGGGEMAISFTFPPGKSPAPKSFPPREIATVLFAGSADGKSHVECNCAPAGLRVGEVAEIMRDKGLEIPLAEGPHRAELWMGKNHKTLTIQGSLAPSATIAVFSNTDASPARQAENR
jgi:tetratricopeptide (TPR) repeat protein